MIKEMTAKQRHLKRHQRSRTRIHGTPERPRLSVFRSLNHIYAQLIDDQAGHTLAAASSLEVAVQEAKGKKTEQARQVGRLVARRAIERGIKLAVLDRGGYRYHGRVKALAEGARESGLQF